MLCGVGALSIFIEALGLALIGVVMGGWGKNRVCWLCLYFFFVVVWLLFDC